MSDKKRVVITGMGVVSCLGHDPETFHQNLYAGKSGIASVAEFAEKNYETQFGGKIYDFEVGDAMDRKQARRADRYITYAMYAGKQAMRQAGMEDSGLEALDKKRCGVLIGSGMGGMDTFASGVRQLGAKGPRRMSPFFVPYIITNMGGAMLAMDVGFMGPNYSISTACATANYCLANGYKHIVDGDADVMVCGGAEATMTDVGIAGFIACRALSERNDTPEQASRPWDKGRDGFVMGEGAGVFVLESLEHAKARGATILAELCGVGLSCDAHHMTNPRDDGLGVAHCIEETLGCAQVAAEDVTYVNAHATSTPAGDIAEIRAIQKVLTDPSRIIIHATKSMTGHCLGAAAGIEGVATVQALRKGEIHPTINLTEPEEEIQQFIVPTVGEKHDPRYGLSLSFGFGGHNAAVLFGRYDGE